MDRALRRWAIALGVSAVLLLSAAALLVWTTPEDDGANIGAGIIGLMGLACGLGSVSLGLWRAIAKWQSR